MSQTGVLLINLGTPDDTSIASIRRYLREFLLDPRVIDLPAPLRYLLVYGAILPFRPRKTAKAYQKIWQPEGSPLRIFTAELQAALSARLGEGYRVAMGMRYGQPSIASAVQQLAGCQDIIVLPLFPQYSSAATGSAIEKALAELSTAWNIANITVVNQFFDDPGFIQAYADLIKPHLDDESFLLLSYHGLPERHLDKSQCKAACNRLDPCPAVGDSNAFCYRAQAYATTTALVTALSLPDSRYMTVFQSRLGRVPWIQPYTDQQLQGLRDQGVKKLVVACPSFVADCLETLEEIGIQLKTQWLALGGESFTLVPCLNADASFVAYLADLID